MTRWAMDDQFLGHHKTKRAMRVGLEALLMWFALRTYVSINLTDGFIPDEDIDDLPHAPKGPRRWLQVLVECGKPLPDGSRGPGLVDQVANGWKLHDYEHHGELKDVIEARRASNRDRQKNLRERKSKQPPRDATERATHGGSNAGTNGATHAVSNGVRNGVTGGVTHGGSNGPLSSSSSSSSSDPDPDLPTTTSQGPESSPRAATPPVVVVGAEKPGHEEPEPLISCPKDLRLTEDQVGTIEMSRAVPRWAIDDLTSRFVANFIADPADKRTLSAWRKCLSKAVCGDWGNPRTRPTKPEDSEAGSGVIRKAIQLDEDGNVIAAGGR